MDFVPDLKVGTHFDNKSALCGAITFKIRMHTLSCIYFPIELQFVGNSKILIDLGSTWIGPTNNTLL